MDSRVKEKKIYLLFLWHMHQPVYKDASSGVFKLPWVFLHAVKDYSEMLKYFEIYPLKATFNFVPSLLDQLKEYQNYNCEDATLSMMKKEVKDLTKKEREFLLPRLFWANEIHMIKPLTAYLDLYEKFKQGSDISNVFTDSELLDAEVLFLLSWTGTFIREESTVIKELLLKGRNFGEEEKRELFSILHEKVRYIFTQLKSLKTKNRIEITLTPYYHPILPLLVDMNSAKQALPDITLPERRFSLVNEAEWHVSQAVDTFYEYFEDDLNGMWPAEGSISSKALELFSKADIKWVASDEDVLANSLGISFDNAGKRRCIYERHYMDTDNGKIFIFFRDKRLSDLIGFKYSKEEGNKAAEDFISKLRIIYDSCDFSPVVPVILDGENAWEHYPNNGRDFLNPLYQKIADQNWICTSTISEALGLKDVNEHKIGKICAGSWIRGDFATWVGHPEKNKAWELFFDTKETFDKHESKLNDSVKRAAADCLRVAEGSDWFWWYGDDHHTDQLDVLDEIFRSYLIQTYKTMDLDVPSDLLNPVNSKKAKEYLMMPKNAIYPVLDGRVTDFFEYLGAGRCDLKNNMSAMHLDKSYLDELYWGIGGNFLFLMLEIDTYLKRKEASLRIEIQEKELCRVECDLNRKDLVVHKCMDFEIIYAFNEILEIKIPLEYFSRDTALLRLSVMKNGDILDIFPLHDFLRLPLNRKVCDDWTI